MKFKIGDMIKMRRLDPYQYGILIESDYETSIGTPFDWLVMFFDGSFAGCDEREFERIQSLNMEKSYELV